MKIGDLYNKLGGSKGNAKETYSDIYFHILLLYMHGYVSADKNTKFSANDDAPKKDFRNQADFIQVLGC